MLEQLPDQSRFSIFGDPLRILCNLYQTTPRALKSLPKLCLQGLLCHGIWFQLSPIALDNFFKSQYPAKLTIL